MRSKNGPAEHPKTAAVKAERKKILILGVLLVLIVVAISAQWNRIIRPTIPVTPPTARTAPEKSMRQPGPKVNVKNQSAERSGEPVLEYPLPEALPFAEEKRNIFAFFVPPPPPPDPELTRQMEAQRKLAENPPPPVCGNGSCESGENHDNCPGDCSPPPPPPAPPIQLKYIGFLRESNGSTAFMTDGKEIFIGKVNDVIANKYRVVKITDEGVELSYLHHKTNQTKTIPFEGIDKN